MTPDQIEKERVSTLKLIAEKQTQIDIVSSEIFQLERRLLELKESKRKGRFELSLLKNTEEQLRSEYWRARQ